MLLENLASEIVCELAKRVNMTIPERERAAQLIVSRIGPLLAQPVLQFGSPEDEAKSAEQCEKMLGLLKQKGAWGVTNVELSDVALNYTARISDLRSKGYLIHCSRVSGRVFNYTLVESEAVSA